jgi:hypothetical protein
MPITPTAQRPGSSNGGLYLLLFLAALLGGEYYVLTTPAPKTLATAQVAPAPLLKRQSKAGAKGSHRGAVKAPIGKTVADSSNASMAGAAAGFGNKIDDMKGTIETKAREIYGSFGLPLRGVCVLVAIVLVFAQGPPKERVGAKRKRANPAQIKKAVYGLSVLMVPVSVLLLYVHHFSVEQISTYYPASGGALLFIGFLAGMMRGSLKQSTFGLQTERKLVETPFSFNLPTNDGGYINVKNPDRGTLVLGGAGAGKSYSIGEPVVEQFAMKGRCGLIYDFKFPVLAAAAQKALILAEPTMSRMHAEAVAKARKAGQPEPKPLRHHIINFTDMERTEKVNPFRPEDMPDISYAMEYAQTIISNLGTGGAKGGDDFFEKSAYAYLTSIIWFYRNNYPQFCTMPHVVATALFDDLSAVLSMLKADPQSAGMAQSLIVAVEQKAEKQVAAVVASLQIALVRINTPNIAWVLNPDEERGEGFSLNLNDPLAPKLLTIGNNPTLAKTFSPVIACVVATALKLMNQQDKHPSYVFLDEAATIYVPGLEVIPATARSNKVAMIYMTQDMAQMTDAYGPEKMKVLISNLNNQFIGKVNSLETAKFFSDMIGREDKEMVSVSSGKNQGGKGGQGMSENNSVSLQERNLVRPQDVITLEQGEFIGQTVETDIPFFKGTIVRKEAPGKYPIQPMTTYGFGEAESERIQIELNNQARERAAQAAQAGGGGTLLQRRKSAAADNYRRIDNRETRATNAQEAIIDRNFQMIREEVEDIITSFPNIIKQQEENAAALRASNKRSGSQF